MKKFSIILALDNENGIGRNNVLAWRIPEDMKYFRDTTIKSNNPAKQNAIIMGRNTWESIPEKYRPLEKRKNFILSRKYVEENIDIPGVGIFAHLDDCLRNIESLDDIENIFIIGGAQIYNRVLAHPQFHTAYITRIYDKFHCDVFFDGLPTHFQRISRSEMKEHNGVEYEFLIYKKKIPFLKKIFGFK